MAPFNAFNFASSRPDFLSLPISVLFQYRIFPVVSFRRIVSACGAFVIAFETASTIVFILECTPTRDFWLTFEGYDPPDRCIDTQEFLLVNGSINTVTDFALLLLVGDICLVDHSAALMRALALTDTLASESKHAAEISPDWHLCHWFSVSSIIGLSCKKVGSIMFLQCHCREYGTAGFISSIWNRYYL